MILISRYLYALLLCPFPALSALAERSSCSISLDQTTLEGVVTASGACRYSLRYGNNSERWGYSTVVSELRYVGNG